MDAGLLIARMVFGALFAAHGSQKLFGWFGGYGLDGTGRYFDGLGFRPGRTYAAAAGVAECLGGVFLAFGLVTPVAAALVMGVMIVAMVTVHRGHGLLATGNGVELPLLYLTLALTMALMGPGAYSLDAAFGLTGLWTPEQTIIVLILSALGAFGSLNRRRDAASTHV